MNSKTAQLTANGTEIVRLFARFALGASFLSAVADRFGLWGPHGAKNVSWGDFAHFVEYTRSEEHTSELQSLTNLVCRLLLEKKKKKIVKSLLFVKLLTIIVVLVLYSV